MGLTRTVKGWVRDSALHRWFQRQKDCREVTAWEGAGRPMLPPQAFKRSLIRDMSRRFSTQVLVETGTHYGDTVAASLATFRTIYSIELMGELYQHARSRFARHRQVNLRHGDSAHELTEILSELNEPALFWLDAHYSGTHTARGDTDTPIMSELRAISRHAVKNHVILIDDARCFDGTSDYPTIDTCRSLANSCWPASRFQVVDDIIRITPQGSQ